MGEGTDFNTVRVCCKDCGWFRNVGYTGQKDNIRALIRITKSPDPSHLLKGKVKEFPDNISLNEITEANPEFRDLNEEAHQKGLYATMKEFNPLLVGSQCPRCKSAKNLCLESMTYHGREIRF